jgi:flagellar hook protein FlgE
MTFETALSGLNGASKALDVTGDNISNANTIGFKLAQTHFADIFAASVAGAAASSMGLGSGANNVVQSFKQGAINSTNNPLDMAINGRGFFRMDDNGAISYTRNGQFHAVGELDSAGGTYTPAQLATQRLYVVNDDGHRLMGYNADYTTNPTGTISTASPPTDILIDTNMPASATTNAAMGLNLDSRAPYVAGAFDPYDPSTYNIQSSVRTYDAAGKRYDLTTYYANVAANTWRVDTTLKPDVSALGYPMVVTAGANDQFTIQLNGGGAQTVTLPANAAGYVDSSDLKKAFQAAVDSALGVGQATVMLNGSHLDVLPAAAGGSVVLGEGNGAMAAYFGDTQPAGLLTFDSFGKLSPLNQSFAMTYQAGPGNIQLDFSGTTQYASTSGVNSAIADGYGSGQMTSLSVGADGVINANYSNSQSRKVAQVVLANFANSAGLVKQGDNRWLASAQSGAEQLDTPANANAKTSLGLGSLSGAAVESSNIDLGAEMINLITQQRYYQANAQAIKTQDQVLQTLSNIR